MAKYLIKPEADYGNPEQVLSNYACATPFRHIEIHMSGKVSACCQTWLPTWVGNLLTDSPEDVINNLDRRKIQDDMRQGKFTNCNDQCPQLNSLLNGHKREFYWDIVPKEKLDNLLAHRSMDVYFSYDPSCNLQCPSCRHGLIVWDPEDMSDHKAQQAKRIHEKVKTLIELLVTQHSRVVLSITGSGDPFASPLYWGYLEELASKPIPPNLFINLQTNGVMMTEQNWNSIKPLWPHISYVNVSVDAATEETYKIVRKNGNFKRLQKNLDLLDQMIVDKCFPNISGWQSNLIVQKANYKELAQFVEWHLGFKSKPIIWTNLIAQWYHMDDTQFKAMAIWQDNHPEKSELIEILKNPIFNNDQVKLGNMAALVPK
jgi:pyruvate-formate lyase-activating enzyme